ncbi:MAG: DUF4129 domain-containing protein [Desulfarculaceae bacterium]|jgi:hypothetical protein
MNPKAKARPLTALSMAGLELCWLSAWANYLSVGIFERPFPWSAALIGFLGAGLVHGLTRGRGLRVYVVVLAHLFGLAVAWLWLMHFYHGHGAGLHETGWLKDLFLASHPITFWFGFFLQNLLCGLFWWQGAAWQARSRNHEKVLHRFDLGLSLFLLLFLVKFMLRIRFQEVVVDSTALPLLASFFCFSFLALAQGRVGQAPTPPGRSEGTGYFAVIGMGALLLAAGVAAFSLPWLREAADHGYRALKAVAGPIAPYLVQVLRFLLAPSSRLSQASGGSGKESGPSMLAGQADSGPAWLIWIVQAVFWLMLAAGAVLIIVMLGFLARRFWLLMISRTGRTQKPPPFWEDLRRFMAWLLARLAIWLPGVRIRGQGPSACLERLGRWGKRGGVKGLPGETPREYGRRLGLAYPRVEEAISRIVQDHESTVYGGRPWGRGQVTGMKKNLRRLKNPRLWPRRLFTRLKSAGR